jgi:hypothetical protein
MKLWYTLFVVSFITVYGTLSVVLLGSWIVRVAKSFRGTHQPPSRENTL